jgi:hypothetical protein
MTKRKQKGASAPQPDPPPDAIYWMGEVSRCDICQQLIKAELIDGATVRGPWASMDPTCHGMFGIGLGLGKGQRYVRQANGRWLKVEG